MLQRLVDKGLDMDISDIAHCGYALGVTLKIDMTRRRKAKRKEADRG